MHYSVDAHAIGEKLTGNEVYIRNLIQRFPALDATARFTAFLSVPEARPLLPESVAIRQVSRNPFLRLGFQLSRHLHDLRPDLLHVQYTAPLNCPCPIVVSVHDVSFLEYPEYFTPARALQLQLTVRRTVLRAARVLTPSEFSRKSILSAYGVDPERVTVVPNAVAPTFRPLPGDPARRAMQERFGIRAPFVLSICDLQPRKNHLRLIRAFADVIRSHPELPHRLVLTGKETWFTRQVRDEVRRSGCEDRIQLTGWASDEELLQLYAACEVFVYPSLYEGFGLPVLEAMACGKAVACSNATAIPEVADSAALLFDPHSVPEIARALADLMLDGELRARMERLALQRAAQFSWDHAAAGTLEVYAEVARSRRRVAAAALASVPVSRS
jgi:glycosyltransferase involved in cell wall biosynthesis